jgi:hypothetical protein
MNVDVILNILAAGALVSAAMIAWIWLDNLQTRQQRAQWERDSMWDHDCPVERARLSVGAGEPCSWCGAEEQPT